LATIPGMSATFDVQDDLLRKAESLAARSGRTLGQVVEAALRQLLERAERAASRDSRGVQPGVDLEDSVALFGLMERGSRFPGLDLEHPPRPEDSS
jgi:hypothetical protein